MSDWFESTLLQLRDEYERQSSGLPPSWLTLYEVDEDEAMDWPTLEKTIADWSLPSDDQSTLITQLRRVFRDNPDSAEKAAKWLDGRSELFNGAPSGVMRGHVLNVPQEIGLPWVLSYLMDCA